MLHLRTSVLSHAAIAMPPAVTCVQNSKPYAISAHTLLPPKTAALHRPYIHTSAAPINEPCTSQLSTDMCPHSKPPQCASGNRARVLYMSINLFPNWNYAAPRHPGTFPRNDRNATHRHGCPEFETVCHICAYDCSPEDSRSTPALYPHRRHTDRDQPCTSLLSTDIALSWHSRGIHIPRSPPAATQLP